MGHRTCCLLREGFCFLKGLFSISPWDQEVFMGLRRDNDLIVRIYSQQGSDQSGPGDPILLYDPLGHWDISPQSISHKDIPCHCGQYRRLSSGGTVIARGCSTKDKLYHVECENHVMGKTVRTTETFCYCSYSFCNSRAGRLGELLLSHWSRSLQILGSHWWTLDTLLCWQKGKKCP